MPLAKLWDKIFVLNHHRIYSPPDLLFTASVVNVKEKILKKKILLTRPRKASLLWASRLSARNYDSLIEPLLHIEPTTAPRPAGDYQAVLLTSTNAPENLDTANSADLFSLPCFCVGAATGAAAGRLLGRGPARGLPRR